MSDNGKLQDYIMGAIEKVKPGTSEIFAEVDDYRKAHPNYGAKMLASNWADKLCWLYAAEGAASALPGAIPGLGLLAQIPIEGAMITTDLAYMLRCMAGMVVGVGHIYGRHTDAPFNQEFVRVLGLWCGVLHVSKEASIRIGSKIAIAQFKKVPGKVFQKINQRVGTTIVTKYGTKRGGIAIGRLVPLGVGALVGGGFNLATMKGFKAAAVRYYETDDLIMTMPK